jgi:glycosyltransferase involved in cell wall biosynthesis
MKTPVSILIPAYNAEGWIADTLCSALQQTWPNKEIIVVDDGSTDQTLSIARKFASRTVSVVSRPHQGAAASRNHALALSRGEYIQWLDADDLLAPDKIEKQMALAGRQPGKRTLFSGAWGRFYYRVQRARFSPTSIWREMSPVDCVLHKMNEGAFFQTCAWLVSRELAETAGPWDARLLGDDDGEYFCRVMLASDNVVFVPEAVSYWRITGANSLSYIGFSTEKREAHFLAMQLQINHLLAREQSERVRAACLTCLQSEFLFFYPESPKIIERMKAMAADIGGQLEVPQLSWKYAWMRNLFGWGAAKHARFFFPNLKRSLVIRYDQTMFRLESMKPARLRGTRQAVELLPVITAPKPPATPARPTGPVPDRRSRAAGRKPADTTH